MLLRIASALVLVPAVLALVFFAPPTIFLTTLGIVGTLCLREYFELTPKMGFRGQPWFGYVGFWFLMIGLHWRFLPGYVLVAGLLLSCLPMAMWSKAPVRDRVTHAMVNLLGILYLALLLYPALPLRFGFGERLGLHWVLILLSVIWAGDVAAFFVGRSFGRTPLSPVLSPKKTNEGALGGLLAGVAAAVSLQHFFLTELPLKHVIILSLLLGIMGQLGDLAESMLKRAADVKDTSSIIPGHGGVLDRIDSLLFAIPALYIYLLFLYPSWQHR